MLSTSSAQQFTSKTMNGGIEHAPNGQLAKEDSVSTIDVKKQFDAAVNVIRNLPATPSKDGEWDFYILLG